MCLIMYMFMYMCAHCRSTTIPGRTKGKRKVQIKLPNCQALQPSDNPAPVPVAGGEGGGAGAGESRPSECLPVVER